MDPANAQANNDDADAAERRRRAGTRAERLKKDLGWKINRKHARKQKAAAKSGDAAWKIKRRDQE